MKGTWLLLPMMMGLSTLSIVRPTANDHTTRKTAHPGAPCCTSQMAPGMTTSSGPPGITARKNVNRPSSPGECRPLIQ